MAELIINSGSDVSKIDFTESARQTLSNLADNEEMVKILISNGANLSAAKSDEELTLLHLAAREGTI